MELTNKELEMLSEDNYGIDTSDDVQEEEIEEMCLDGLVNMLKDVK